MEKSGKGNKFDQAARTAIEMLAMFGMERITISALARKSGVSRPWIYKYIGSDPGAIVDLAIKSMGEAFTELNRPAFEAKDFDAWNTEVALGTRALFEDVRRIPALVQIYWRYHETDTSIGKHIREIEGRYLARFAESSAGALKISHSKASELGRLISLLRMGAAAQDFESSRVHLLDLAIEAIGRRFSADG